MAAVLSEGNDARLILRSPYDATLVQALKDAIPYRYREWDGAAKLWRIDADWGDVVLQTLECLGISVADKRPVAPQPTVVASELQQACTLLYITPDAPMEVAEAAFKALARLYHPDVGGDTATFQAINNALATFKVFND